MYYDHCRLKELRRFRPGGLGWLGLRHCRRQHNDNSYNKSGPMKKNSPPRIVDGQAVEQYRSSEAEMGGRSRIVKEN